MRATAAMTTRSAIIRRVPMGSQDSFSFSSLATISVPPVVAPWRRMRPMEKPSIAPPHRQASSRSSMGAKV